MAASAKVKGSAQMESVVSGLKDKFAALEAEQETARQAAEQAEAAWKSALADQRLGEGGKPAIARARAELDAAREDLIAVDGALGEISRRLAEAEERLLAARLAALVRRADEGAAELAGCVEELLELDRAAGLIRQRMAALEKGLLEVRSAHGDLDLEGRSPGTIGNLAHVLFEGMARSSSGINVRGNAGLGHIELSQFLQQWGQGPRAERLLGGGAKGKRGRTS